MYNTPLQTQSSTKQNDRQVMLTKLNTKICADNYILLRPVAQGRNENVLSKQQIFRKYQRPHLWCAFVSSHYTIFVTFARPYPPRTFIYPRVWSSIPGIVVLCGMRVSIHSLHIFARSPMKT